MQINTDNLLALQRKNMQLESDLFHERWKFRYVSRRLKELDPNEAVSEEELDEQIRSKEH